MDTRICNSISLFVHTLKHWPYSSSCMRQMALLIGLAHWRWQHLQWERVHGWQEGCVNGLIASSEMKLTCLFIHMGSLTPPFLKMRILLRKSISISMGLVRGSKLLILFSISTHLKWKHNWTSKNLFQSVLPRDGCIEWITGGSVSQRDSIRMGMSRRMWLITVRMCSFQLLKNWWIEWQSGRLMEVWRQMRLGGCEWSSGIMMSPHSMQTIIKRFSGSILVRQQSLMRREKEHR